MTASHSAPQAQQSSAGRWLWAALLVAGSVVLTGKFSCATPFAALAALAALDMSRRDGLLLVLAVWLANQAVGYGLLGYPQDAQSYAWGVVIGIAAVAAYVVARAAAAATTASGIVVAMAAALAGAFVAYEAVLIAATNVLPSGETAFSWPVIGQIALVNVIAFAVLLILHRVIATSGWLPQLSRERLAA